MNPNTTHVNPLTAALRRRGFTLVELLAVVAIMVLMLKLTLPALSGLMGNKPHLVARGQFIADLNNARTRALRNGWPVYVVFMPLVNPGQLPDQLKTYLREEGNGVMNGQLVSYALYAEYLPGDQFGQLVDPPRGHHHMRPRLCQSDRASKPNSPRAAGHKGIFAVEAK